MGTPVHGLGADNSAKQKAAKKPFQTQSTTLSMNWSEAPPGNCWNLSLHGLSDVHDPQLWCSAQFPPRTIENCWKRPQPSTAPVNSRRFSAQLAL